MGEYEYDKGTVPTQNDLPFVVAELTRAVARLERKMEALKNKSDGED